MKQAQIVVAADRTPLAAVSGSDGPALMALRQLHEQLDACWVGRPNKPEQVADERLRPISIQGSGYDTYSRTVLWPLFNYLLDSVRLDACESWQAYVDANMRFARALAAETEAFDTVWIHDYQLALVPALLRQLVPSARIGFLLHVPWPSLDVLRILPTCKQILSGLLGADLVGFQTANDRHNFLYAASEVLGADSIGHVVRWQDRAVHSGVYPVSVDMDAFARSSADLDTEVGLLRSHTAGKCIVLGVDRLDGTQGVPQKLHAIDRLLEREPKLRDNLHYIQLAAARHHAEPSELRREVNELVARINSRHGSLTGSPVQLLGRSIPIDRLIALYRAASVMLVTPLREGMSLVAQEYVGARSDGLGCLVLSEFAGASCGLVGALHVNPYDTAALASTIQRAMAMPEHEQRARMRELRHALSVSSSRGWAGAFLSALGAALRVRRGARWPGHDAHLAANLPGAALRQLRTEVDRSID